MRATNSKPEYRDKLVAQVMGMKFVCDSSVKWLHDTHYGDIRVAMTYVCDNCYPPVDLMFTSALMEKPLFSLYQSTFRIVTRIQCPDGGVIQSHTIGYQFGQCGTCGAIHWRRTRPVRYVGIPRTLMSLRVDVPLYPLDEITWACTDPWLGSD